MTSVLSNERSEVGGKKIVDAEWKRSAHEPCGVICGCNVDQEWLLPWWWERYSAENAFPVTFVDFGMTEEARLFCESRGELISMNQDPTFVKSKQDLDPTLAAHWESSYGKTVWQDRLCYYKKPFALLHSSYKRTLWLDMDCEVIAPLDSLFSLCQDPKTLALVREHDVEHLPVLHPDIRYNGGVILFAHGARIISHWAEASLTRNDCGWGDDILLSALLYEEQFPVLELPEIYNWRITQGINLDAYIYHWVGKKNYIKTFGGIKPTLDAFKKRWCSAR